MVTPGQLNRHAEFYYQLGSMLSAGVPLIQALEMASSNPTLRGSRRKFSALIQHLQAGLTFSESMQRVQGWMPDFDIALLGVGETSGRLDSTFKVLSSYYASRARILRDAIAGMLISAVTLHVFLIVFPLGYLIAFAQGVFNGEYSTCVPFVVQKLVTFGLLYGVVFFLIFASQGRRGERWRSLIEMLVQFIPVLRTAQRYLALSRLASALEAVTNAGVSIIKGWDLSAAASGSPRLRRIVAAWKPRIEAGATPGEMTNSSGYFPGMFANLYNTAEQSGKLDETLHRLHVYYQEEGFRKLRFFAVILNGTIYGLIVLLVAYNVIRFYMQYYGAIMESV